jgi:hypothetical protein
MSYYQKKEINVVFSQIDNKTNYTIYIDKDTTIDDIIKELKLINTEKLYLEHKELLPCDYLEVFEYSSDTVNNNNIDTFKISNFYKNMDKCNASIVKNSKLKIFDIIFFNPENALDIESFIKNFNINNINDYSNALKIAKKSFWNIVPFDVYTIVIFDHDYNNHYNLTKLLV